MNIHYSDGFIQIVIIKMSFLYILKTILVYCTNGGENLKMSKYMLIYIKKIILSFFEFSLVHLSPFPA